MLFCWMLWLTSAPSLFLWCTSSNWFIEIDWSWFRWTRNDLSSRRSSSFRRSRFLQLCDLLGGFLPRFGPGFGPTHGPLDAFEHDGWLTNTLCDGLSNECVSKETASLNRSLSNSQAIQEYSPGSLTSLLQERAPLVTQRRWIHWWRCMNQASKQHLLCFTFTVPTTMAMRKTQKNGLCPNASSKPAFPAHLRKTRAWLSN